MASLNLPDRVILLGGGCGRELRLRGVEISDIIWSTNALLVAPGEVLNVHLDNIAAGADVITTNTYGVIRRDLTRAGMEHRFAELKLQACELAGAARERSGCADVLIAGKHRTGHALTGATGRRLCWRLRQRRQCLDHAVLRA